MMNATDHRAPPAREPRGRPAEQVPLCVDLDGTLLAGDSLYELLFAGLRRSPALVFLVLLAVHASAGIYRLALKWGVGSRFSRPALKRFARGFGIAFLAAGVFVLAVMAGWIPAPFAFLMGS